MKEELLMKAMQLKKESEEIERQLEFIEAQIKELGEFNKNLESFDEDGEKEIFASVGKGIFIKADKKDEKLFVDVGSGVILKKSPKDVKEIIESQIIKFQEARAQLREQLEEYASAFYEMLEEVEEIKGLKSE